MKLSNIPKLINKYHKNYKEIKSDINIIFSIFDYLGFNKCAKNSFVVNERKYYLPAIKRKLFNKSDNYYYYIEFIIRYYNIKMIFTIFTKIDKSSSCWSFKNAKKEEHIIELNRSIKNDKKEIKKILDILNNEFVCVLRKRKIEKFLNE